MRFISGISYTNSELFVDKWQPHGWAEVYFPEIGWVSFDPTFGEYGYIDVTHIKLHHSTDPTEPSVKYEWLADKVTLNAGSINIKVNVVSQGTEHPEEILLEQDILSKEVDLGSYNLIKGIAKNTGGYYVATTLQLAAPKEIGILGRNKRTILLGPKEVKETYWIIRVSDHLNPNYWYTFPAVIYSEKNVSVADEFKVQLHSPHYSENDVRQLIVTNEDKSYSRRVSISCKLPKELFLNESKEINCTLKNSGNSNLNQVNFCVGGICETVDLPINQQYSTKIKPKTNKVGWNKLIASAENQLIDKKVAFDYAVMDAPKIKANSLYPESIHFGDNFKINLIINKTSFSNPKNIEITIKGGGVEQSIFLEELKEPQNLSMEVRGDRISKNNRYELTMSWKDQSGKSYSNSREIFVKGIGDTFAERIKMMVNGMIGLFQ
ncbi:transglutaminase domain-containing protein [Candidatus Woesearchaeota archaeon]|nr:transglutaminase domain-containing protein [Candidatus Woesearchaeota archaeon]